MGWCCGLFRSRRKDYRISKTSVERPSAPLLRAHKTASHTLSAKDKYVIQRSESVEESFNQWDRDNSGHIDKNELKAVLDKMHVKVSRRELKRFLSDIETKDKSNLNRNEFATLYKSLRKRRDIKLIFRQYATRNSPNSDSISSSELHRFFTEAQRENVSMQQCQALIKEFCGSSLDKSRQDDIYMDFDGFQNMLTTEEHGSIECPYKYSYNEVDMHNPITDYFIASSHNTYLGGDQFREKSDADQYRVVLQEGCRCVELDVYDGPNGEPDIMHKGAMTKPVSLRETLDVINRHAFETSQLPVILSLQNRASYEQQKVMADMLKATFGSRLQTKLINGDNPPTPLDLLNKIIIKDKKPDVVDVNNNRPSLTCDTEDEENEIVTEEVKVGTGGKHELIRHPDMLDIVVYTIGRSFVSFKDSLQNTTRHHISSFAEGKVISLAKSKNGVENWVGHNGYQLSRTYPKGTRVFSSNYDPVTPWALGCQIVALNYQTRATSMLINTSHFKMNGGCGFILKPESIRLGRYSKRPVRITIIGAARLDNGDGTRDIADPYVVIDMYDFDPEHPSINDNYTRKKTAVVDDNGLNPIWDETFDFKVNLDTAYMVVKVKDKDLGEDDDIGRAVVPMRAIRQGYRFVDLQNKDGSRHGNENSAVFLKYTIL